MSYNKAAFRSYRTHGSHWGMCDRCGFKYSDEQLEFEWTGVLTCQWCGDDQPEDMYPELYNRIENTDIDNVRDEDQTVFDACTIFGHSAVAGMAIAGCAVAGREAR